MDKLEERLRACCPDHALLMFPARGPGDESGEVQLRHLILEAADEITRLNAEVERARADALEDAAKVAEAFKYVMRAGGSGNQSRIRSEVSREIASAIRSLILKARGKDANVG